MLTTRALLPHYNDQSRAESLRRISAAPGLRAPKDHALAIRSVQRRARALYRPFIKALDAARKQYALRLLTIAGRNEVMSELDMHIRDFWDGLERRNRRHGFPKEAAAFYRIPCWAKRPQTRGMHERLEVVRTIIDGDEQAVAHGWPAMLSPSKEELQAVLNKALKACDQADLATSRDQRTRADLVALREKVKHCLRDLAGFMGVAWRGNKPARRDVLRKLGYRFTGDPAAPQPDEARENPTQAEPPQAMILDLTLATDSAPLITKPPRREVPLE